MPPNAVEAVLQGSSVISPDTERDAASFGWALLSKLIEAGNQAELLDACFKIAWGAAQGVSQHPEPSESPRFVVGHYLEPLFDYLDEILDEQGELLGALLRFQQWAAWFGHQRLADVIADEESKVGAGQQRIHQIEKRLQRYMFEWLFVDGLALSDVAREPLTGVGRPDFHFLLHGKHVAAEVKLYGTFGATTYEKASLRGGVRQLLQYMDQYACTVGYLIVFNGEPAGLRCRFPDHHDGVARLTVAGNRAIYVLVVAATEASSASAAGSAVDLQPADLLPVRSEPR